ncbi:hypothetical protein [Streptomyces murinus]|uniref:hypothetical protein n=1 Tax=Streptomyces murinus TaxID=33900 RepID=UPI003F472DEE
MTTHRLIILAAAALTLASVAAPAHANADITEGKVSLNVQGHGLRVQRADGWMDGHGAGVRARLYTVYKAERTELTGWKAARPRTAGSQRFMQATWKLNRSFPQGAWLCVQFNKADGNPCAQIHR